MASDILPAVSADDHADHMAGNAVFISDNAVRSTWVSADCSDFISVKLVPTVRTFIAVLLLARRPFAVLGTVAFVIIDTLKRQFRVGARSHIGKKILEIMPSFTNCDTSAAIVVKALVCSFIAAAHHAIPNKIFRALGLSSHNLDNTWEVGVNQRV